MIICTLDNWRHVGSLSPGGFQVDEAQRWEDGGGRSKDTPLSHPSCTCRSTARTPRAYLLPLRSLEIWHSWEHRSLEVRWNRTSGSWCKQWAQSQYAVGVEIFCYLIFQVLMFISWPCTQLPEVGNLAFQQHESVCCFYLGTSKTGKRPWMKEGLTENKLMVTKGDSRAGG